MNAIVTKRAAMALKAEDASGGMGSPVTVRISSSAADKAKDTLNVNGWSTDEWNENPVVLWMHDSFSPPVARGLKAWVEDGFLKSQAVFAPASVYPLAGCIEGLVRGDFVRAASVGFVSDDYSPNDEGGLDFASQILREWSFVTIGCNGEALVEAKFAGIDTEPLREWAHHTLERIDGSGVWVPRDEAARIVKTLGPIKTFSIPTATPSTESNMKTLIVTMQIDEAKFASAKAELEKKAKNAGGVDVVVKEAEATNDSMESHIKALGEQLKTHKGYLDAHDQCVKATTAANETLASHIKALKDMADGDGDKATADAETKGASVHKLSAPQMKRAKSILKAVSDQIAAHHSAQGAPNGEPAPDEDGDDDGDKATAAEKRKALEAELAELIAAGDKLETNLTGRVPDKSH